MQVRAADRIVRICLAGLLAAVALAGLEAGAQGPLPNAGAGGLGAVGLPRFEPEGVWGEILSVTPKWIVIQTDNGQQFPVSLEATRLFVLRWPTTPALIGPDAWAEVTGLDVNSNMVMASQVDIYEGAARNLVTPVSNYLIGYNRVVAPVGPFAMGTFGYFQLLPGEELMPRRRHVVGPLVNRAPLAIAVSGNDAVRVQPTTGGMVLSQVTPGSFSFVRPGDIAWFLPVGSSPRTLSLARLIVYKPMPVGQFVP
jgi:hypothetical protein